MEKIGTYTIIDEKPLIVEYYHGIINFDDLVHFKNIISKESNYNLFSNTILDLRDCTLDITDDEMPGLINYLKRNFKKKGIRRVAYLTSKPNEVVLTSLYKHLIADSDINYNPEIFSTIKATANFFGPVLVSEKELLKILAQLRTNCNNVYEKKL